MRDRYDQNECASVAISIILTISIEQQVVTGNACLDIVRRCLDIFHCVSCGNMLHSNFQCWEVSNKWLHDLLDEYGFSIEDVSLGDFRMDAEHHLVLVQFLQNLIALSNIRDSHVTVCCCTNWIVLASDYTTGLCGFYNFFRFRLVGQVSVISGSIVVVVFGGSDFSMCCLYWSACSVVTTGGFKLGIMRHLPKRLEACARIAAVCEPSRQWW